MGIADPQTHLAWIDLRLVDDPVAIAEDAIHTGAHGLPAGDSQLLATLPPSVQRVGYVAAGVDDVKVDELAAVADILIFDDAELTRRGKEPAERDVECGAVVTVHDQESPDTASAWASRAPWTVIDFKDPTKIPLEIVLAAADKAVGRVVTVVHDLDEARIVFDVSGSEMDLIVQDDWHVRILGPSAEVRNVTELAVGDLLAGSTLPDPRHVGYAVREFLLEK